MDHIHTHPVLKNSGVEIVWFDSLGAKSSCISIRVDENDCILIDPGAAEMQPSYPVPKSEKTRLRRIAVSRIVEYSTRCSTMIITHYHYDHHLLPSDKDLGGINIYGSKTLYIKDPNRYINLSQWRRARRFLQELLDKYSLDIVNYYEKPRQRRFRDPVDDLRFIHERDYGDYWPRRRELLLKGKKWFRRLADYWKNNEWIRNYISLPDGTRILFADNSEIRIDDVYVWIFPPWFHGVEYDKTGWVTPVYVEKDGHRILYTSDLMGPIIEDYAYIISELSVDIAIIDGPPTYLFPYMFNRINLNRTIENMKKIIDSKPGIIIYDHHLLRDPDWRKHVSHVIEYAKRKNVELLTAAEALGEKPLTDRLRQRSGGET